MDESTYNQLVSKAFKRLLTTLDAVDPDLLDTDSTGDMITITAARGEKCIINTQRAVHQLWVAGKGQGIHFSYDAGKGQWLDDRGRGLELFTFVADVVKDISGAQL